MGIDWEHVVYCRQWKVLVLTWWSKFVIEKGRVCSSTRVEDDSISCFGDVLVFILNFYLGTKTETRQSIIFYSASGLRIVPMLIGYIFYAVAAVSATRSTYIIYVLTPKGVQRQI